MMIHVFQSSSVITMNFYPTLAYLQQYRNSNNVSFAS